MLHRPYRLALVLAAGLLAAGCASTTLQDQWRDPAWTAGPFRSFLVVGLGGDPVARRIFEDTMVAKLRASGVSATQAYLLIPDGMQASEPQLDAAVAKAGADALMMTRLRGVQTQTQISTTFVPGPLYGPGWYGYYNAWYPVQQISQYQIATVDTSVFATSGRVLVWTGVTQTFNPQSVTQEAPGLADVIVKSLAGQGLLPAPK
jgi:hypothetical protein